MARTLVGSSQVRTRVRHAIIASLALAAVFLLGACASPRIDGSSDEAFRASVLKVRESVPESDRARFDKALVAISTDGAVMRALSGASRDVMLKQMRERLAGKTAADVLAEADQMEAQGTAAAHKDR